MLICDVLCCAVLCRKEIEEVHCGGDFSAVRTRQGEVFVWGSNHHGQLGLGDQRDRYEPVLLNYFRGTPVRAVALAAAHMLVLTGWSHPMLGHTHG